MNPLMKTFATSVSKNDGETGYRFHTAEIIQHVCSCWIGQLGVGPLLVTPALRQPEIPSSRCPSSVFQPSVTPCFSTLCYARYRRYILRRLLPPSIAVTVSVHALMPPTFTFQTTIPPCSAHSWPLLSMLAMEWFLVEHHRGIVLLYLVGRNAWAFLGIQRCLGLLRISLLRYCESPSKFIFFFSVQ